METAQDSFSYVEYISVFTAFIYGHVATRFFSGWSAMINFRQHIRFSKEHIAWTLLTFGLLIDVWWGSWIKWADIHSNIALYYLSLFSPIIFYLISIVQFPSLKDDRFLDLQKYFNSMRRRNYLAFIGLFIYFLVDDYSFKSLVLSDIYFNVVGIALATIGYFSNSKLVHHFILTFGCVMLMVHVSILPSIATTTIGGFSLIEYLTVFTAFIYGSIASRFLTGWGVMISKFDRITFSKEHIAWTLLIFCLVLDFWTGSWQRESFISKNINYFILSLALPMTLSVAVAVSFPNIKNEERINMKDFFLSHKKIIYGLMASAVFTNAVIANSMEESSLLGRENFFRLAAILLALTAAFSQKQLVERVVLALGWVVIITHLIVETLDFKL